MATRTVNAILADVVGAFKTHIPMLQSMGANFTKQPLYLGQTCMAHVESLPVASTYDPTTGYANGMQGAGTLLSDVPVIIDGHTHVPIQLTHVRNIADEKKYVNFIGNQAYVLGKQIVDSVLAKVNCSNISHESVVASANFDYDELLIVGGLMNTQGAATTGRIGILSTAVMNVLMGDPRCISRDYAGQMTGANGMRSLRNVGGFEALFEYPALPSNNYAGRVFTTTHATETCNLTAHGFTTGTKVRVASATTLPNGYSADTTYWVIRVTADTFRLATSAANALAPTPVAISDDGTGDHTVTGYENLTGFFFDPRAFALMTGVPSHSSDLADEMGIPKVGSTRVVQDPESGLSLMSLMWQSPATFDLNSTLTALYGSCVGRQAGAAGAITDNAGLRLVSAT